MPTKPAIPSMNVKPNTIMMKMMNMNQAPLPFRNPKIIILTGRVAISAQV
jgi:hypothetical protein